MKKIFYSLLICFSLFGSNFAQDETRTAAAWRVLRYDITATLPQNPADRNLTARAVLNLRNVGNGAGSRLTLRISDKAEVISARVGESAASFTKGEEKLGSTRNLQRIILNVPTTQPNGTIAVSVEYKLKVEENSGVNAISPGGSQFLPLGFWYPTPTSQFSARGADFAPFRLNVISPNETVISSGAQNGTVFEQKLNGQPFFITGSRDKVEAGGVSVFLPKGASVEERKRAEELAAVVNAAKSFTAGMLGNAPDAPIRIVSAYRGAGFADGGTILVSDAAFRRQKLDSQTVMTIAESIVKIWLGNVAAIRGEGSGAVREGLARFIATEFLEKQFGKDVAEIERQRQRTVYAAIAKRDAPLNIVTPFDDYYLPAVANKGAMIWRILSKAVGQEEFYKIIKMQIQSGNLSLANLRASFVSQQALFDYGFNQVTDLNLLVGLPQPSGGGATKVALRNLGSIDVSVSVSAITERSEKLTTQVEIPAKSFGEAVFKTTSRIVRTEIDSEKFYPQIDYSDDVAPREFSESDAILVIKRAFDKQDFATAEKNARIVLRTAPHFDEARVWLGRALLAQGKTSEAEKEFRAVLDEKFPTARSLAWANAGLGDLSLRANQNSQAAKFYEEAIKANAEYGATLGARVGRNKAASSEAIDESIKSFFLQFDRVAVSGRKNDLDAMISAGEITKFSGGIAGQAQQWQSNVVKVDKIDADNVLAEVNLSIKLLNKDPESGTAVFRLSKHGEVWKLSGVEIFEVR